MSLAFGWTVEEVERHVVALIQSGDIKGRVDSQNKVSRSVGRTTKRLLTIDVCRYCKQRKRTTGPTYLPAASVQGQILRLQIANSCYGCDCKSTSSLISELAF